ncbi:hypothetical protein GH714_037579 [Hevea brasiliensis]|uniref:Uncharacterized protein n=1 Tax=Hevea brasiliensis TaxID=3981 RepID=A0A6A6KNG5_HEVBR|nr:hypothetical protein GH714_037579 [Hevea brasiliensis]
METPPQGFRKSVRICLVNASKKGGADEWEDLRFAAMRELREETGVTSAEFLAEFTGKEGGRDQPIGRWIFKDWSWMLPERVVELVSKPYCININWNSFLNIHTKELFCTEMKLITKWTLGLLQHEVA